MLFRRYSSNLLEANRSFWHQCSPEARVLLATAAPATPWLVASHSPRVGQVHIKATLLQLLLDAYVSL